MIIHAIITVIGIICLVDGLVMTAYTLFNIGNLLTVITGAIMTAYGLYYKQIIGYSKKGILKGLRMIFYVGLTLMIVMPLIVFAGSFVKPADYTEDAVIVLGAGIHGETPTLPLRNRLLKAVEYYNKNQDAIIIVSGGQGYGEAISEAEAMERFLVSKGVPKQNILKEEKSTSTEENLKFSKQILDENFSKNYTVAIITNRFHSQRARILAKEEGLITTSVNAPIPWYTIPVNYVRESLATMYTLVDLII
ncbi:MAG: YdcF family protein [Clostridia bacterium]|nr:YdcF family protein [Clostridia bacterium]